MRWFFPLLTYTLGCGAAPPPGEASAPPSVPSPATAPAPAPAVTPPAASPPAPPIQADLHLDTPTQLHRQDVGLDAPSLESGVTQMRAGGTNVAVMALWPPRDADWRAHTDALFARLEAEDARLDAVRLARTPAEARRVAAEGGIALVVALEGAHGLIPTTGGTAGALERLDALHARGLSMLGLAWSFSNPFVGSSGDGGGELTEAGRALVARANDLGVMVDVSHASRAATTDTCAATRAPLVASHSDAHAVHADARNLTDAEIACIAATGGVIGVNFHAPFVGDGAPLARVADHFDHLKRVGGAGVVALGSDYDGMIRVPPDLPDASRLPRLWDELRRRGWTDAELAGARGENFLRAWEAVRAAATDAGRGPGPG